MPRLYVGGLSHLVTERDLKDRFGKFGNVEDVELRTRRDEEGVPYKTFGYININISEADLKKCLTVLNKSKWKGGTLKIETAKESFLHRLAQERQAAVEQCLQPPQDKREKLLDSLSKAGVDNFTMKAAVPGTEIPGHKDWTVSKFGRVLPVMQLKCQKGNRARTMKYDPSKYSHNLRKLDLDATDEPTPITQLTWEVQGGDNDISKKRRGEFPPYQPPRPKKKQGNAVNSHNAVGKTRPVQTVDSVSHTEAHQFTNGFEVSTKQRPVYRRKAYLHDSDVDSDEEIRRLVAAQQTSHSALQREFEDDNLEVVGLEYSVKSGQKVRPEDKDEDDYDSADTDELFASRKPPPPSLKKTLTSPTTKHLSGQNTDGKRKNKRKSKVREQEKGDSSGAEEGLALRKPSSTQEREDATKQRSQKKGGHSENQSKKMTVIPLSESDRDGEDEDYELDSADSCSDSDYEAMFSNVTHMEISLADLQRLAEETQETSETTAPSIFTKETNLTPGPAEQPALKKGILPEEILAAIMEEDCSEDEQKKKKKKKRKCVISTPLPAFQGMRTLKEGLGKDGLMNSQKEEEDGQGVIKKQKLDSEAPQPNPRTTHSKTSSQQTHNKTNGMPESSEEEEEQEKKREVVKNMTATEVLKTVPTNEKAETSSSSLSSDDDEEEEEDDEGEEEKKIKKLQTVLAAKSTPNASLSSSRPYSQEEQEKQEAIPAVKAAPAPDSEFSSSEEEKEEQGHLYMQLMAEDEEERQRKANQRRLAAVQQRQKEAEEHKRLIQGALANLDAPRAGAGKRIVFCSDDEDEQPTTSEVSRSKKTLFQDSQSESESTSDESPANESSTIKEKVRLKPSGPQLFGGSEDEDDGDKEEDGARFDIRPEFEGQSGQKLMALQSRFGTDERFRMDSRFLEDDVKNKEESGRKKSVIEDDDVLEEERKKNLEILQSVLGSSQQICSKTASKAKTFRDISVLHYDPSKEEHAAYETTPDEAKESKSARRKKRQEAQKLPEVSKEIFFDISGDLKAVFGPTKCDAAERKDKKSWDQEEEKEEVTGQDEEPPVLSPFLMADPNAGKEESAGFKFSFFGDDTETENKETEYKVERIQAPKVSWQQDPRFHDNSSDEDEAEQEEEEEQTSTAIEIRQEKTTSVMNLFFFYPEDSRLTEGPRLFFRPSQLEEQREQWEERRTALRQEYRKKHKDARRKLKSSQKS